MKFYIKRGVLTFSLLASLGLSSCSNGVDSVAPVIEGVSLNDTVFVDEEITFTVDANDNITKSEDLTVSGYAKKGTILVNIENNKFVVPEVGVYEVTILVSDTSANETSFVKNVTAIDPYSKWTDADRTLFNEFFKTSIPYPEGLSETYQAREYEFSSGIMGVLVEDVNGEDLTVSYGELLLKMGYKLNEDRSGMLEAGENVQYMSYIYEMKQKEEINPRKYLTLQVDYFPGNSEYDPCFEIFASYTVYPKTKTSTTWDRDFIKKATQNETLTDLIPAYKFLTNNDKNKFVYNDYHEHYGHGFCSIDIYNTNLDDAKYYIELMEAAGFLGGRYDDFVSAKENTFIMPPYNDFIIYLYNKLDNKEKIVTLTIMA